jgi:hypothetical protein
MSGAPIFEPMDAFGGKAISPTSSIDKSRLKDSASTLSGDTSDLLPQLDEKPRFTDLLFNRRSLDPKNLDAIATRRSAFDDPQLREFYWPSEKYENLHRFDPNARWTFREEMVGSSLDYWV